MPKNLMELNQQAAVKIAEAIKTLSGQVVKVDIVEVKKRDVREIRSLVRSEEKVAVIYIPITGALEGASVFVLPEETAFAMADYLQKRELGTTLALTGPDISALKEFGNITVCTYLSVISNEAKIEGRSHGGRFSFDIFSAVAEEIITDFTTGQKAINVMEISFSFETHSYKGDILFLLKDEKINALLGGVIQC